MRERKPALRGEELKGSKKIGCKARLTVKISRSAPKVAIITLEGGHNHRTGALATSEDLWHRVLDKDLRAWIVQAFSVVESIEVVYGILNNGDPVPSGAFASAICAVHIWLVCPALIPVPQSDVCSAALTPPPRPVGSRADDLANTRWHPSREQLRELKARANMSHVMHPDDLTSVRKRLAQLDRRQVWTDENKNDFVASQSTACIARAGNV